MMDSHSRCTVAGLGHSQQQLNDENLYNNRHVRLRTFQPRKRPLLFVPSSIVALHRDEVVVQLLTGTLRPPGVYSIER